MGVQEIQAKLEEARKRKHEIDEDFYANDGTCCHDCYSSGEWMDLSEEIRTLKTQLSELGEKVEEDDVD